MKKVRIGIIGAGFIANVHAGAYQLVQHHFGNEVVPELVCCCDIDEAKAKRLCEKHNMQWYTTDWHKIVESDDIDAVVIATYNDSHVPIAIEAAKHGKHIHSEKPLGMNGEQTSEAVRVIKETGVIAAVGFNCCKHPLQEYVKRLIASGELGDVLYFRGCSDQDYYLDDPTHTQDFVWRMSKEHAGSGALGDLLAHTISLSQYLIGDTAAVSGMTQIVFPERPDFYDPSKIYKVENDDICQYTFRYANGAIGYMSSSRVAAGRKMGVDYEIQLTKGAIRFSLERMNEVQIYHHCENPEERGFKTVYVAPGHGDYSKFYGGAGIEIGYSDGKVCDAYHFLRCVAENKQPEIGFEFGDKVQKIIDAVLESAANNSKWVEVKK